MVGRRTWSWGLADGLGLTLLLALVTLSPFAWLTNPLYTLVVLVVGACSCAPSAVYRWRTGARPTRWQWIPVGAALALLGWVFASALASGAPWPVSFFGWEGRYDGLLALVAVVLLALEASTLTRKEVQRLLEWVLVVAAVLVLEGLLQVAGVDVFGVPEIDGVWGALGNPNFYGAACGILSALALGLTLDSSTRHVRRICAGAIYVGLGLGAYLSASVQGPLTCVIATCGVLWLRLVSLGGRRGLTAMVLGCVAGLGGALVIALGLVNIGPGTWLWDSPTTGLRKLFWDLAWRIAADRPIWGTGPDGLARFVGQYRSDSFVQQLGVGDYLSAAHNLPLQYAATVGFGGLAAWLVLVTSALVIVAVSAWKGATASPWTLAAVGGALLGYVAQAMVSIDALDLKALAWTLLGLSLALTRPHAASDPRSSQRLRAAFLTAGAGLVGFLLCLPMLFAVWTATSSTTVDEAAQAVTNPVLPCRNRTVAFEQISDVADPRFSADVAARVQGSDLRCPGLPADLARAFLLVGDVEQANELIDASVATDPLLARGWLVLANLRLAQGDREQAAAALERTEALNSLSPDALLSQAIESVRQSLASP